VSPGESRRSSPVRLVGARVSAHSAGVQHLGAPDWPLLCGRVLHGSTSVAVTFVAFDVLRVDGHDLTRSASLTVSVVSADTHHMRPVAATVAGSSALLLLIICGIGASGGLASTRTAAASEASSACAGAAPIKRTVERWGCFATSGSMTWTFTLGSPCGTGSIQAQARWSGSGGDHWIGDDGTQLTKTASFSRGGIVLVGPATFDMKLSGLVPHQGSCVAAETISAGCGARSFRTYGILLQGVFGAETAATYRWAPTEAAGTRPPGYSQCGGGTTVATNPSIQPYWRTRYGPAAEFALATVPRGNTVGESRARAATAAASRILSTGVGKTLTLRAQQKASPPFQGSWTGKLTLKRLR